MKILLTGAGGFIGKAVLLEGLSRRISILPVFKHNDSVNVYENAPFIANLNDEVDWTVPLRGVDVVIHLAGLTHVFDNSIQDSLEHFRRINVKATLDLAHQAAEAGVRRFIFLSSIKVNGESTEFGRTFSEDDIPSPSGTYGVSKAEAEAGLMKLADDTPMEVCIIRPPLVYGVGAKGNFSMMFRWIARGLPLPFGRVTENRRSFIALDNLVDFIFTCVSHPKAANQLFLISDGQDVSTAELLRKIQNSMGRRSCLIGIPVYLLEITAKLFGKQEVAQRLLGSLQVDIRKACILLGWKPPITLDAGLGKMIKREL